MNKEKPTNFAEEVARIKNTLDALTSAHSEFVKEITRPGRPITENELAILSRLQWEEEREEYENEQWQMEQESKQRQEIESKEYAEYQKRRLCRLLQNFVQQEQRLCCSGDFCGDCYTREDEKTKENCLPF